jgi:hypothetical protein
VQLKYVTRKPGNGRTQWAEQAFGTGQAGKRQIITVSGPEITDVLPKDDYASVRVQTVDWKNLSAAYIKANDAFLSTIPNVPGGIVTDFTWWTGYSKSKTKQTTTFPAPKLRSVSGKALTTAQKWFVISTDPLPEWAQEQLGAAEVIFSGTWGASWILTTAWSQAFKELMGGASFKELNVWRYGTNEPGSGWDDRIDFIARPVEIRGWVVNASYASLTAVYKAWEYDYLTPPANLAENLRDAQSWVPYEGSLVIAADSVDGVNRLNRKLRVANAYAPYATMDAMLRGVSHDFIRGRTTFDLGAPARTDLGSMIQRVKRNPQDNIEYL